MSDPVILTHVTTVRDYVLSRPNLEHATVAPDIDLLRRAIESAGAHSRTRAPRWSHVGALLGHGAGVSWAICQALGLDPDEEVGGRQRRSRRV